MYSAWYFRPILKNLDPLGQSLVNLRHQILR